jgi:hypothetical protein
MSLDNLATQTRTMRTQMRIVTPRTVILEDCRTPVDDGGATRGAAWSEVTVIRYDDPSLRVVSDAVGE